MKYINVSKYNQTEQMFACMRRQAKEQTITKEQMNTEMRCMERIERNIDSTIDKLQDEYHRCYGEEIECVRIYKMAPNSNNFDWWNYVVHINKGTQIKVYIEDKYGRDLCSYEKLIKKNGKLKLAHKSYHLQEGERLA